MTLCLAADIGGTKTLLSAVDNNHSSIVAEQRYSSTDFDCFEDMLSAFINNHKLQNLQTACIGVAGPVQGDTASVTNLPWKLNAGDLQRMFSIQHLELLNDFQIIGYALSDLHDSELQCLQAGHPVKQGVRALIGAGTGLGHAIILSSESQEIVLASEAGHIGFAPTDAQQDELLRFMRARYKQVSYERLVSGPGLEHIYWFLNGGQGNQPPLSAAEISDTALSELSNGQKNTALSAMDLFISLYGAAAGNFALACLASGGIFIAGGIAPRLKVFFERPTFIEAFCNKSKMDALMHSIPVYLVTNAQIGLRGAVRRAVQLSC